MQLATANASNTDTVSIWLTESRTISWGDGNTTVTSASGTPLEYSHTYSSTTPNIGLSASVTYLRAELTSNFTITTGNINQFSGQFLSTGAQLSGSLDTITNIFNTISIADNELNTSLTGDIGLFLSRSLPDVFSIYGGVLSSTTQDLTGLPNDWVINLIDNQIPDANIDVLSGDLNDAVTVSNIGTFTVLGENQGFITAASSADRAALTSDGCTVEVNLIPITSGSYSNTGQTFTEGVLITDLTFTAVPDASPDIAYVKWGSLPAGLSFSTTTGVISGTLDASTAGTYDVVITSTAFGNTYTGHVDTAVQIVVEVAAATWSRILINVGNSAREVVNTEDPNNKYWNNVSAIDGTIADLVDEDNNATGVSFALDWQQISSAGQGRRPADGVYPDDAWDSSMLNFGNDNVQTATFNSLPSGGTYDVTPGACDDHTTANRQGDYTVGAETLTLDAELNPPQTITFSGKSETSGELVLSVQRSSGELACYLNFIELIKVS